jgi:hypothetical protein
VRKLVIVLAVLFVVAEARAATVVLVGGKRLEVSSFSVNGSYVTVQYPGGRRETYPVSAVDLPATKAAAGGKGAAAPATESGPHSPFLGAKASPKGGGLVVTDADVKHIDTDAETPEAKKEEDLDIGSQVVLVSYSKKQVDKDQWEIAATVANQGKTAVQGVTGMIRVLDSTGKPVATGSGALGGKLDAGKQGTMTARVSLQGEPAQVAVDLSWQEIKPAPKPAAPPAPGSPRPAATAPAAAPSGWTVPQSASPNTMPSNLLAVVAPTTVGTAPQVPRS